MSRKNFTKKKTLIPQSTPDPIYNSSLVTTIINRILLKGKRKIAEKIFYKAMKNIKENLNQDPMEILRQAIVNVTPSIETKATRIRGSISQIPLKVNKERGTALAIQWIINSSRERSGRHFHLKVANEITDAYSNIGLSIKKKDEMHKKADASRLNKRT